MITTLEPQAGKGTEELLQTVSATRLNTWLGCRLRYYFKYVLRLKSPRTAALYVGATVHSVLKQWNRARWRKEVLTQEQLQQAFDSAWAADQQKEMVKWVADEEPAEKKQGWALLQTYFKNSPVPQDERPEGVEVPVEADLTKHGLPKLIGILDLVRAGGLIVDYKTVGQTPKDEKAIHSNEVQLSSYSVLYREATGKVEGGRELHQLVKLKEPKLIVTKQGPMTEQQRSRLFKQLESYVEGVERQDFVPSPGMQCVMCSYFNECRRWDGGGRV
jgi:putative RecB family exonuclease